MGSLGQVEGVQMASRQETPAALTADEKEKGLGEGEESDRRKSILYLFFLRRKNKILYEEKQQREKEGTI